MKSKCLVCILATFTYLKWGLSILSGLLATGLVFVLQS
jgi:hypothetical protein